MSKVPQLDRNSSFTVLQIKKTNKIACRPAVGLIKNEEELIRGKNMMKKREKSLEISSAKTVYFCNH
jgi:hypothetical protein